jgi:hypothetical protein
VDRCGERFGEVGCWNFEEFSEGNSYVSPDLVNGLAGNEEEPGKVAKDWEKVGVDEQDTSWKCGVEGFNS